jgi:hypothetical protein
LDLTIQNDHASAELTGGKPNSETEKKSNAQKLKPTVKQLLADKENKNSDKKSSKDSGWNSIHI